ncbi:MAG: DNA replication/repair protein RecF, partial [Firmicutes bacterium]|nr:DNA replication/repair protein RecF [Bacillota bacterium]
MYVKNVSLKNYRNYESANVTLSSGLNVLVGQNAQGKTNFLESIYIGATGHSNRTNTDRELIQFQSEEAHVRLMVHNGSYEDRIDVHLKRDDKKGMAVNGIPIKKLSQLFGTLLVVMFSPEDLQLIKSGPAERRRFVDLELCQLNPVYYYELQQYFRVLKQRNNLLKSLYKNRELLPTLAVWDEKLIEHGGRIETLRQSFIERLNVWAGEIHRSVTNGREELGLFYKANVSQTEWADKLRKSLERDIAQGSTSVGIHKDDVGFFINGSDARIYGSQGQQRTA